MPEGSRFFRVTEHPILEAIPATPSVTFTFGDESISAYPHETVAAALLASGIRQFRTMPKEGETRGPSCLVGRCADCLVIIDGVPNQRACLALVRAGMIVEPQSGIGHLVTPETMPEKGRHG